MNWTGHELNNNTLSLSLPHFTFRVCYSARKKKLQFVLATVKTIGKNKLKRFVLLPESWYSMLKI